MSGQARTLKEQLQRMNGCQHRLAVWEMLYQHIDSTFISKDGRPPKGLKAPGANPELVPEEIFEELLTWMSSGPISQLQAEISTIENQQVVVIDGEASAKS